MPSLLEHLNWHVKQPWHRRRARAVLETPPLTPRDDGVVICSMLGHGALYPGLVAVKSFARALGRGHVMVIDDGSLTAADRALLAEQLGQPEVLAIGAIDTGPCPRGGTWERLLAILDARARDYVIQIDSDTLTLGDVTEVRAAIDANRAFSLRGDAAAALTHVDALATSDSPHIQHAAERAMAGLSLPGLGRPRYFRGCSGFAGFPRSESGRGLAEAFSVAMQAKLGAARWAEWGTEQVTSNFVIANEPDPLLLPYGRYRNFWCDGVPDDVALMHFLGTNRFAGMTYFARTAEAIAALR